MKYLEIMLEIRVHGRGGQGAVTTGQLIAISAFYDKLYPQTFPKFGVERRGAPVESYARIDSKKINLRSQIYYPDIVIVLDASLLNTVDVTKGMKKNGIIIVNTNKDKSELNIKKGFRVNTVDATSIALNIMNKPIVNTSMLGAFAKITGMITVKSIKKAIDDRFDKEVADINKKAVQEVFENTK